ncbi:metalloprotease [Hyalangium gracile]|uniref:metalloprotease n=1 Tax=Hyalangium gracile TaxID=394092 RepID=UPI001CCFCF0B|nr:site-2 protease family protein [Hyalangium gracile]
MALRFRVAGFPVQVHPLFFLTALATGLTGWNNPARLVVWFCVVFISVLIHELGHALAFRHFGHASSISLHGLGGTTRSESGRPLTHRQDLWISLAGPVAGFLLGGLVLAIAHFTPVGQAGGLVRTAVRSLLWANFGWGVFNLLPLLPLDGGHVLAAIVRERGGPRYEWLIYAISLVTAVCGLVLAIIWRELWLGLLALVLGGMNVSGFARAWIERKYIQKIRAASQRLRPAHEAGQASPGVERFLSELRRPTGRPRAERLEPPPKPREPPPERPASPPARRTESGRASVREEDLPELPHDSRFVGELLLGNGLPELAIRPLRAAFEQAPSAPAGHALITALLEARRYADITGLLATAAQAHLGDETLALIATRADSSHQPALAERARELRQGRARSQPLPARGTHDSEKPG